MKVFAGAAAVILATAPVAIAASPHKATEVLVHGAFETSGVWDRVTAKLEKDGYSVKTVDLPGRPGNEAPMSAISLDLYQQTIATAIAGERHPVVLVGHSFGGFAISAEAEAEPDKVQTLLYVAAYLPRSGDSLLTMATADRGSKLAPLLVINKEKGYASVAPEAGAAVFASDAPAAVQSIVAGGIVNEPLAPLVTPIVLTDSRFGSVDKVTIRTLRDQVVSTPFQVEMAKSTPVRLQLTIDTGHTPFVTEPNRLALEIEKAAGPHRRTL
ncbi:alpha/beta fold hydrolase (plasmid) [Lichenicola cladoniae]|uniref:Alpha/beta fold hydrolase n=1 Tax=Lichenicola cladoniae TaxID=1484109 RepID=A0A6M8HYH2_9PROT|nr:alpha/beta fold hydrolase [Lichenicola cladoniae]NPD70035.1 alpha/beta fold hydrolase [Acetobacteraceae bacterium]QKE93390.1 alpha/beta fold hydrolase [Lichenicola cladoniae]